MTHNHEYYMRLCFELAKKAIGQTSPNPYVGCVIVKDNQIIARGYHKKAGLDHAEADALNNCKEDLKGATLYCNLEPCCHTNKKTAPCAQRLLGLGLKEVVICNLDPNPAVSGKGVKLLENDGIKVTTGILKEEGLLLNEVFFSHITKKRPFIHLKWAQTLDGKIATLKHHSKWITNSKSRENSHKERNLYDAILIGAGTLNHDNPSLTIRLGAELSKKRIVLSPTLEFEADLNLFNDKYKDQTIIITNQIETYKNIKTLYCPMEQNTFELNALMDILYNEGICSLYIEGGMQTISSFIDANLFDRVSIYMAPKLLGPGITLQTHTKEKMDEALSFSEAHFKHFQNDILFQSQRNVCLQD